MSSQPISGLESVLSRISQIQSYQQQLLDPAASSSTTTDTGASATDASTPTATTGTTASTASTAPSDASSSGSTNFAALLAALQSSESSGSSTDSGALTGSSSDSSLLSSLTGSSDLSSELDSLASLQGSTLTPTATSASGGAGLTPPTGAGAPAQVQDMTSEADSLLGKPYVWGGGHNGWGTQTGYDCSGFVSAVLHAGGYLSTPQDTVTLPSAAGIEAGPGQYVTIYDRTDAGAGSDHVIIDINGQFYESGGEAGSWGGGGGVQMIAAPSAAYLATFNRILHPAGL